MGAENTSDSSRPDDTVTDPDAASRTAGPGPPGHDSAADQTKGEILSDPTRPNLDSGEGTIDWSGPGGPGPRAERTIAGGLTAADDKACSTDDGQPITIAPTADTSTGPTVPATHRERPLPSVEGYEVLGELGRGGMGVVYRAREVRLNRPCVLKMILAGAHADAEAVVRCLAEADAVARLQHPNVVQIHHIGEAGGLPFFELEYVGGGSLDRRLDGTPWKATQAVALVEALARGISEAHRLGIVHRDLKPANVLLSTQGLPRIADWSSRPIHSLGRRLGQPGRQPFGQTPIGRMGRPSKL